MFVFILKRYPQSFAFLILKIIELFTREVCKFFKSRLILIHYSMVYGKQKFHVSHVRISQKLKCVIM